MKILIESPITVGYGSPGFIRLYRFFSRRGHDLLLFDRQEDPAKQRFYYKLPGVSRIHLLASPSMPRLFRGVSKVWTVFRRNFFNPDVVITQLDATLMSDWARKRLRVMMYIMDPENWTGG